MFMKILFVCRSLSGGGAERVVSLLASALAKRRHVVSVATLESVDDKYVVSPKVKRIKLEKGKTKLSLLARLANLRKCVRAERPDVIVPFLPIVTLYTMIADIGLRHAMVTSERANPYMIHRESRKDEIAHWFIRKRGWLCKADGVVFQTESAKEYYGNAAEGKSYVIPNPIDESKLPRPHQGKRETVVYSVGRLSSEKNFSLLIEAFASFHETHPDYRLVIYGEGKQREELQRLAKSLGVGSAIDLPGFTEDVLQRVSAHSMFVSSSNHEGMPNALAEALAMGVPCIATDCPAWGSRFLVDDGENGILVPVGNAVKMTEAMCAIADDESIAENLSSKAVEIREKLAIDAIVEDWELVLRQSCERHALATKRK